MDLEEVYLRQIVEQLRLQNKLKEDGNDINQTQENVTNLFKEKEWRMDIYIYRLSS